MQAPMPSQRSEQRRSPNEPGVASPNMPVRSMSPANGIQPRTSTNSVRSIPSSANPKRPNGVPNQIEKSVTHLLVATKQLLETLTSWSRNEATDTQVSDIYVRLGYEFNIACRAFSAINVDTSDLGDVPEELRHILESTLSQEASIESLDRYLPKIRDIIIGLLHGLKRKQQRLRQKEMREQQGLPANPRNSSLSSVASGNTGLTTLLNEGLPENYRDDNYSPRFQSTQQSTQELPPHETSRYPLKTASADVSQGRRVAPPEEAYRESHHSEPSSMSSTTMQNIPVLAPGETLGTVPVSGAHYEDIPPVPPPKHPQDALAALQRGGDLERRASRRYSAYQISKHLGSSPSGVAVLPPPQNSPIPNRGRDTRESMNAVRGRGMAQRNQKYNQRNDFSSSPVRYPIRISEETSERESMTTDASLAPGAANLDQGQDHGPRNSSKERPELQPSSPGMPQDVSQMIPELAVTSPKHETPGVPGKTSIPIASQQPADSRTGHRLNTAAVKPPVEKDLTLFLQYKSKIKKFVLANGFGELSVARLQLAFIEKFAWNTHNNGVDLPEIYIQDPVSGVRHELEDLSDVRDRSVLVLNVEALDEVKKHIDEGIHSLKEVIENVRAAVDEQKVSLQSVTERQQDTAKDIARLTTISASPAPNSSNDREISGGAIGSSRQGSGAQLGEVQGLRRDLAVLRRTYSSFKAEVETSMSAIKTKASSVKAVAIKTSIPDVEGDSGRAYVNAGKKTLLEDSDKLVSRVDDLQDIVEDLRKDVVLRGVRPLPRQLETVAKDISLASQDLKKMNDYLKRERPIWTKIWEKELETVCNDREEMTMQEDLAADLQDDLEKATQTFALVEQATKEQMKDIPGNAPSSSRMPRLNHVNTDPATAKEGVLGEVRALQPNHENRLEAIERAEKLRRKELEGRGGDDFEKELGMFVQEGMLKKSGGFEEVERRRIANDEKARREVWERQNGVTVAQADVDIKVDEVKEGMAEKVEAGVEEGKATDDDIDVTSDASPN